MTLEEEQISPEEKLLKVIQDGDEEAPDQTPEEKLLEATREEPVAEASLPSQGHGDQKPEEAVAQESEAGEKLAASKAEKVKEAPAKPKIKVKKDAGTAEKAKKGEKVEEAEKEEKIGEEKEVAKAGGQKKGKKGKKEGEELESAAGALGMIGAESPPVVLARKSSGQRLGLRVVNWGIAAVVVLMLGLSGIEIFASVRGDTDMDEPDAPPPVFEPQSAGDKPYNLSSTLAQASARAIFGMGEAVVAQNRTNGNGNGGDHRPPPQVDWVKEAKARLSLAGRAKVDGVDEVVVSDQKTGALHFLRVGKAFSLELSGSGQGLKLTLDKIDSGVAYITDGKHVADIRESGVR